MPLADIDEDTAPLALQYPTARVSPPVEPLAAAEGAAVYMALAAAMPPQGTVAVGSRFMTRVDCLVRGLELGPGDPAGWVALGKAVQDGAGASPTLPAVVVVQGRRMTAACCAARAIEVALSAAAAGAIVAGLWHDLVECMADTQQVAVQGRTMGMAECLAAAAEHTPGRAGLWARLALLLPTGSVTVFGVAVDRELCLCRALAADPDRADAWLALGVLLADDATVEVGTTEHTRRDCLLRSVAGNPHSAEAWGLLAATSTQQEAAVSEQHTDAADLSKVDCWCRAAEADPRCVAAWDAILGHLESGAVSGADCGPPVAVVGGQRFSRLACLVELVCCDPADPRRWLAAASAMDDVSAPFIRLRTPPTSAASDLDDDPSGDQKYTVVQCLAEALAAHAQAVASPDVRPLSDHDRGAVWLRLGRHAGRNTALRVAGRVVGARECYSEALRCGALTHDVWLGLGEALGPADTVTLGRVVVGRVECFAAAVTVAATTAAPAELAELWGQLAAVLGKDGTAHLLGRRVSAADCAAEAAVLNPTPQRWLAVAALLDRTQGTHVAKVRDRAWSRLECVAAALDAAPDDASPWDNAAALLHVGERVTVRGREYGPVQCSHNAAWIRGGGGGVPASSGGGSSPRSVASDDLFDDLLLDDLLE